jgi:hypothetical protein
MRMEEASAIEREKFYESFDRILEHIEYKEHKSGKQRRYSKGSWEELFNQMGILHIHGIDKEIEKRLK